MLVVSERGFILVDSSVCYIGSCETHLDGGWIVHFRIFSIVLRKTNCGSTYFEILLVFIGRLVELRADDVSEARSESSPRERKGC